MLSYFHVPYVNVHLFISQMPTLLFTICYTLHKEIIAVRKLYSVTREGDKGDIIPRRWDNLVYVLPKDMSIIA